MNILGFLITFGLLLICVSVHEFSHGWVAYKLGDNTAKYSGRLTLNPLAHIDLMGTIILPLFLFFITRGAFIFGAAKPVPVNFSLLRNPKRDIIWVGLSGPAANFILAILLAALSKFIAQETISYFLWRLIEINVILGVFNLIPIPPLDGSRVAMGLLPRDLSYRYASIEPYGFFIVLILLYLGLLDIVVAPAVRVILQWLSAF